CSFKATTQRRSYYLQHLFQTSFTINYRLRNNKRGNKAMRDRLRRAKGLPMKQMKLTQRQEEGRDDVLTPVPLKIQTR
ncbi:unnamed protein product, partial [Urochloa humidicola]